MKTLLKTHGEKILLFVIGYALGVFNTQMFIEENLFGFFFLSAYTAIVPYYIFKK